MFDEAIKKLLEGEDVTITPKGNSMTPKVKSGEEVTLEPITDLKKGDIVLVKVNGRVVLHLISALAKGRVQISNNHGHVNGWTSVDNVYGKKK